MSKKLNLLNPVTGSVNKGVTYAQVNDGTTSATLDAQYKAEYVENTLAGELQRIKAYIAEIGREAAFLALKAAGANVDQNSKLDQIAEAMLSIVKNSAADASNAAKYQKDEAKEELVLDAGNETVLPAGYYVNSVTVKATSLRDQSQATATAKDILDGATAWVNGVKITGTSTTNLSDKSAGNAAYTEVNDKLVINLKGADAAPEDYKFDATIKFVGIGRGYGSGAKVFVKDTERTYINNKGKTNNVEYGVFLIDSYDIIMKMKEGLITGTFTVCKRGRDYGIKLIN